MLVRPELFNILRITHKDFKNGCFFKGLGWSRPNFRDLKVPRPRQDRDFSYPRPRPGLRDLQKMVLRPRPRPRPRPGLETTTLHMYLHMSSNRYTSKLYLAKFRMGEINDYSTAQPIETHIYLLG